MVIIKKKELVNFLNRKKIKFIARNYDGSIVGFVIRPRYLQTAIGKRWFPNGNDRAVRLDKAALDEIVSNDNIMLVRDNVHDNFKKEIVK